METGDYACRGDRGGAGASVDEENAWTLQGLIAGGPISCDFSEKVLLLCN